MGDVDRARLSRPVAATAGPLLLHRAKKVSATSGEDFMRKLIVSFALLATSAYRLITAPVRCAAIPRSMPRPKCNGSRSSARCPIRQTFARTCAACPRAAPCRLAVRQGQCRVAAGAAEVLWAGREDRAVRGAVPYAEVAQAGVAGAGEVRGDARRAGRQGRSDLGPEERAAADLQRLLARWRCYRSAGLCELRRAGRLRRAGPRWASR